MARPLKQGLDYFPLDCQLDDKFELIEAEYGLTGFAVVVKLFQKIYGQNGYYTEWTSEVALLFAKKIGLGGNAVSEIVEASVRRGIFDKELFGKYHILTSAGIQKRYLEIVSRRKSSKIKNEYLLVNYAQNEEDADNNGVNVDNNPINDDNNAQSKGKERKGNKSKVKGRKPLTPTQKEQLIKEFGKELVNEYIQLTTTYHLCNYDTIRQWIIEDKEKQSIRQNIRVKSNNQFFQFSQREVTDEEMDELEKKLLANNCKL